MSDDLYASVDPRKREEWRNHDREVKERRRNGRRWLFGGLLLLAICTPLVLFSGWFGILGLWAAVMVLIGAWKWMRAGTTSEEAARRARSAR